MATQPTGRPPWRRRLSELARGLDRPHPPLFAPLVHSAACQIEALAPLEFVSDPTKLAKGLAEMRRVLGVSAIFSQADAAVAAETFGASIDFEVWPPRVMGPAPGDIFAAEDLEPFWQNAPRLQASLEATRRLLATVAEDMVLIAALTGPETLARQLSGGDPDLVSPARQFVGRALAGLARLYGQAGIHGLLILETDAPREDGVDDWQDALRTISNVARFHRIPALMVKPESISAPWPSGVVPCPERGAACPAGLHGFALSSDPAQWAAGIDGTARIVVTEGEVAADISVAVLADAAKSARAMEQEA